MNRSGNNLYQRATKSTQYKRFGCHPNSGDSSQTPVKNTLNNIHSMVYIFRLSLKTSWSLPIARKNYNHRNLNLHYTRTSTIWVSTFVIRMLVGHEPSHFCLFGFSENSGHVIEYCAVKSYDIFNYDYFCGKIKLFI